jgi:hypothetical protein
MFAGASPGWGALQSGITAAAGLLGVVAGGFITAYNQRVERRSARVKDQLESFYSPLLGMRAEIKAKSDLRQKLHAIGNAEWIKLFAGIHDPLGKQKMHDTHWPRYEKLLEHSETQLRDELIPLYRNMLKYFSTHMWLAEKSTLKHYTALTEFVEMWNRHLSGSLPTEVTWAVDPKESMLFPFYEDLQRNFDSLTKALKDDPVDLWQ